MVEEEKSPLLGDVKSKRYKSFLVARTVGPEPDMGMILREKRGSLEKAPPSNEVVLTSGDETIRVQAYKTTTSRTIMFWTMCIMTVGIYPLLCYWFKSLEIRVRYTPCEQYEACNVFIIGEHNTAVVKTVFRLETEVEKPDTDGIYRRCSNLQYFTYRKVKFVWYESEKNWVVPSALDSQGLFSNYLDRVDDHTALSPNSLTMRRAVYGLNSLAIKSKSAFVILATEVLSPMYIFQVFSVILWFSDSYTYYASFIVLISAYGIFVNYRAIRIQEKKLKKMIESSMDVQVIRESKILTVDSTELVVGDILVLASHNFVMPCDALLLNGSAIVNESMLTGESIPVTKVPLSGADDVGKEVRLSNEKHGRHMLFCGTTVLQTRFYGHQPVRAVVIRTGFTTLKGQLVRSIMYPKGADSKHMRDIFYFISFLAAMATMGFIYTVYIMIHHGEPFVHILIRTLDIITIVVPPALPAAMSVGVDMSNRRLKQKSISCISPNTITTCGQVNIACFDKTGTLTEDGLDFYKLRAIKHSPDSTPTFTEEMDGLNPHEMQKQGADVQLVNAAATCHSLTRIDGTLHGDPLDLILFNKSGWTMEEGGDSASETEFFDSVQPSVLKPPTDHDVFHTGCREYSTVRQFTFSSALQRMSVIVSNPSEDTAHAMTIYCKGSPEMIKSLCNPETVPNDYMDLVDAYSQRGLRLIAVAYKKIDTNFAKATKAPRDTIECDLILVGLIVMENRLKPATLGVINELYRSNIRCVMITGDNLLTAMSVARECGIIRPTKKAYLLQHDSTQKTHGRTKLILTKSVSSSEDDVDKDEETKEFDRKVYLQPSLYHIACSGLTFTVVCNEYPELVDQLVAVCDVYARMAPEQKSAVVSALQKIDYIVAFCGDGANDCAALKTAHAGISLSMAEASIAAPFTSQIPDISCVVKVMLEGRGALVTSFLIIKYMAAYSLNEFISVMLLYYIGTNLTDFQFMYVDFILISVIAIVLGRTGPAKFLSPESPPSRLMTFATMISVLASLAINTSGQIAGYVLTSEQSWYQPYQKSSGEDNSMEGTALFIVASFQYIYFAFTFSVGAPFRQPIYTNYWLCGLAIVITAFTFWITLFPITWVAKVMAYTVIPSVAFRFILFAISNVSGIIGYFFEHLVVHRILDTKVERKLQKRQVRKMNPSAPLFARILAVNGTSPEWLDDARNPLPLLKSLVDETSTKL